MGSGHLSFGCGRGELVVYPIYTFLEVSARSLSNERSGVPLGQGMSFFTTCPVNQAVFDLVNIISSSLLQSCCSLLPLCKQPTQRSEIPFTRPYISKQTGSKSQVCSFIESEKM